MSNCIFCTSKASWQCSCSAKLCEDHTGKHFANILKQQTSMNSHTLAEVELHLESEKIGIVREKALERITKATKRHLTGL